MKITEIDKNFALTSNLIPEDAKWYDVKDVPFSIHGLWQREKGEYFLRMPPKVAEATNEGVIQLNYCTAGGRVRFKTNSPYLAIKTIMPHCDRMSHITPLGQSGFDLYKSDAGSYAYAASFPPSLATDELDGYRELDGELHTYTLNMPLYHRVKELYVAIAPGSYLGTPEDYAPIKPVLYYGSSITQGGCASRPGNAYQAMISRKTDTDFINLGFSGSARAEDAIVDYLCTLDASVFVCDYDHNAPDSEYLKSTHYKLFSAYRKAHPETPVVLVSKPDFWGTDEDIKRRAVVLETYERALSDGDKKVLFVDGAHIFDGELADSCTVDRCHPNDLGFFRMAQKIGAAVEEAFTML